MTFWQECEAVLNRTPAVLDTLLRGLPDVWTEATEGPNTWSPFVVVGHLIHCEKADWLRRVETILSHGPSRVFEPLDRQAQFRDSQGKRLSELLDQFAELRRANVHRMNELSLTPEQLHLTGSHPQFGTVTLRQLLATWTAHDLAHLVQINRVMAKRFRKEVGPWAEYLSVMRAGGDN